MDTHAVHVFVVPPTYNPKNPDPPQSTLPYPLRGNQVDQVQCRFGARSGKRDVKARLRDAGHEVLSINWSESPRGMVAYIREQWSKAQHEAAVRQTASMQPRRTAVSRRRLAPAKPKR